MSSWPWPHMSCCLLSSQAALLWRGMLEESSNQRWIEFAALNAGDPRDGTADGGCIEGWWGRPSGSSGPRCSFFVLGLREIALVGKVASTLFTMSPSSETWVWLLRLNEGMTQASRDCLGRCHAPRIENATLAAVAAAPCQTGSRPTARS